MNRATDLFERYMLLKSSYPKWFDYGQDDESKMWSLFETGFVHPLTERDDEGRRVILVQAQKLDSKTYSFADILRLVTKIAVTLLEEEETQIAGFVVIVDFANVSMTHLRLFSISDVINFVEIIKTSSIGRHKKMIMVDLPSFATLLLEAAKKVMSEKLRNRIKLIKSMADVQEDIQMTSLPLEYGGSIPKAVMIDEFKRIAAERKSKIDEIAYGVDWDKVALEVDQESCILS